MVYYALVHVLIGFAALQLCSSLMNASLLRNRSGWLNRQPLKMKIENDDNMILRRVDKWACVKNCGACCKLGPLDSRPDLETYLTEAEFVQYKSMIGEDDWCINFDKESRMCKIYEDRPEFCRVDGEKFKKMFDVEESELNVSYVCVHSYMLYFQHE